MLLPFSAHCCNTMFPNGSNIKQYFCLFAAQKDVLWLNKQCITNAGKYKLLYLSFSSENAKSIDCINQFTLGVTPK